MYIHTHTPFPYILTYFRSPSPAYLFFPFFTYIYPLAAIARSGHAFVPISPIERAIIKDAQKLSTLKTFWLFKHDLEKQLLVPIGVVISTDRQIIIPMGMEFEIA